MLSHIQKTEAVKNGTKISKRSKTYFSAYYLSDLRTFIKQFKTCIAKQLKQRLNWLRAREEKIEKGPIDGLDLEYAFG